MKKLLMTLVLVLSTALSLSAKCDWSTLNLQQWNQRNYYKWYLSGKVLDDTCVDYMFTVINAQTKKLDTVWDNKGICEVQFNKKGKYYLRVVVWNKCKKCDTVLYREVNLIYFPNCKFVYSLKPTKTGGCNDSMVGEMTLGPWVKGDTCWQWYSYIWNGPLLDSLNQHDWDSMTDEQLYMYYSFSDSDIVAFEGPKNKPVVYQFTQDGHYLLITQWYNKCLNQDTFFFTRLTIELCSTSSVKTIVKGEPKLIGIYDILGRPVKHIRKEEVLIYLYDDGTSKKVFIE